MLWSEVCAGVVVVIKGKSYVVMSNTPEGVTIRDEDGNDHHGRPKPGATVQTEESANFREVFFDLETGDADQIFVKDAGFIRIAGYAGKDDSPCTTTDVRELKMQLGRADQITGHNILGFDLIAICHQLGDKQLWDDLSAKAKDTLLLARLAEPPRAAMTGSRDRYDLDSVAERLAVTGKSADLKELSKEFGGYDKIPVDESRYVSYLKGDVVSTRAVAQKLPMTPYGQREHKLASLAGCMTLNGFRVDVPLLRERIEEGRVVKAGAIETLSKEYGLPTSRTVLRGRGSARHEEVQDLGSPLSTKEGAAWWAAQVKRFGWRRAPITATGKLSTSATDLAPVLSNAKAPLELKEIVSLMATISKVRTVYQTVADNLQGDRVHPKINMGQASGRWSLTKPGLTVFGKRGGRHIERDIFLPEEGGVLRSCDLAQVDMRAIAGLCQDPAYMKLFEPGRDVHTEIAVQIWGDPKRRSDAKAIGHGANYGLGAKRMIANGHDPETVYAFFEGIQQSFPRMVEWREEVRAIGASGELLDNGFGRKMRCEPDRAYTQAPALMGQGAARDILCDALLRLPPMFRPWLRAMIHDEVLISVPEDLADEVGETLRDAFTSEWRGVPILCDLSPAGRTWGEVSAK